MRCLNCSADLSENAHFCPQCGMPVRSVLPEPVPPVRMLSGLGTLGLTLLLSLALTVVLSAVFGMPIFILGAILPLFWLGRRR